MEKMTRDQALIKLLRENEEKDLKIAALEKELDSEKKKTEKRLKKLEEDFKRFQRSITENEKQVRILKEKSSSVDNDVNLIKHTLRRGSR